MKKLLSVLAVAALTLVASASIGHSAQAETTGAVTTSEQAILDDLDQGVTVSSKTFHIATTDDVQAENYLKSHDVSAASATRVVKDIDASRDLVEASSVNAADATNLTALVKSLSHADVLKLQAYVQDAADALGLKAVFSNEGVSFVDAKTGETVIVPNDSAVKNTGSTYTTSLVAAIAFVTVAAGAVFVAKKQTRQQLA